MMIYTVLLMLIPLLGQIFFISPLELKLPLPESEQSLLWGAGVACSADVLSAASVQAPGIDGKEEGKAALCV